MSIGDKVKHLKTGQIMRVVGNEYFDFSLGENLIPCMLGKKRLGYISNYEKNLLKVIEKCQLRTPPVSG